MKLLTTTTRSSRPNSLNGRFVAIALLASAAMHALLFAPLWGVSEPEVSSPPVAATHELASFEFPARKKLDALTKLGLAVEIRKNRMVISLPGDVLFDSGRDTLRKEGEEILGKVAKVIRSDKSLRVRDYQVAGHTDNKPFKGGVFRDNWGLSSLRASSVVTLLVNGGIDPLNIAAVGFGEYRPVVSNEDAASRATNRRTEVVLVPRLEATPAMLEADAAE